MGLNQTPKGERLHIALFGKRNAGKSSLVNAITGQELAIVSEQTGTTTDPVYKAMEWLPLGPVMLVDTPGLDDIGQVGALRIKKTREVLRKTDLAILVTTTEQKCLDPVELELEQELKERKIPYVIVCNKADLGEGFCHENVVFISAKTGYGIEELKETIPKLLPKEKGHPLVSDLIEKEDLVVLVVPIDKSAPKGRLILPQQQVIRDILEKGGIPVVVRDTELEAVFPLLAKTPKMVITDSQVFEKVSKIVPDEVQLTSFSILMARYKGNLKALAENASVLDRLQNGDKILMAEGCTHHRQCEDIGTVKIPNWIREYTGKDIVIETSSGTGFPEDLSEYALIVHCGACMLNAREMKYRMAEAERQGIPMVNYGIAIAYMNGIVQRSLQMFENKKE